MSKFTEWMKANEMYPEIGSNLKVSDHKNFFTDVYQYVLEDVVRKQRMLLHNQNVVFTNKEVQNYTLLELEAILNVNNNSLLDFPELPQIDYTLMNIGRNRLIAAERMYNANEEWSRFTSLYGGLNPQQRDVYDNIMQAVNERNGGLFFVYGCGDLADLIRAADLIIWDEAPLQHRHAFEAVDRTFRDICRLDNPNADNQVLPCIALDGEDDATWITILEDLLILVDDNPVEAIVLSNVYIP
ncbi:replication factor A protein 1, partial [Tanacetum coccineum]